MPIISESAPANRADNAPDVPPIAPRARLEKAAAKLSRTSLNFCVDALLLGLFLTLIWTSVVLRFVFPAGTAAAGWVLWGFGFDQWSSFQFNLLCVLSLLSLVHLMLHWSWVCGVIASRISRWRSKPMRIDEGSQTIYGVATLIIILNVLGLLVAAAALSVRSPTL